MKLATLSFSSGARFGAEVPETDSERAVGLGGRAEASPMYFPGVTSVWMKPMLVPLDLVFLRSGVVTGIIRDAPPGGTETYAQEGCTDILELPARWATQLGVAVGQSLRIA